MTRSIPADEERQRKTAAWVLQPADVSLIFTTIKRVQALKGRSYADVAERLYGQGCEQDAREFVERQICEMMQARRISVSELSAWYKTVIETVYEHTKFQPLPDFAACVKAVEAAQFSNRRLREAAERVEAGQPVLPNLITAVAEHSEARTLPELFAELRKKLS